MARLDRKVLFSSASGLRTLPVLLILLLGLLVAVGSARAVEVERVVSPAGIEAWLVEDHTNPIVAVQFSFRGGAALDPANKAGLASMTASLLDKGAGEYPPLAFAAQLDDHAIRLGFDAGPDSFGGSLSMLTENLETAQRLLHLALTQPRFDKEAVERVRLQIISGLRRRSEDPDFVARRTLFSHLYPDHPYGRPADGTPETVAAIAADDLKALVDNRLARDNLIVGVTGDITPDQLARFLDDVFAALPAKAKESAVADVSPKADGATLVVKKDVQQSTILFAQAGIKRDDPDYYIAQVLNHVLGGGSFTARLYNEVREKRGLAYSVYSFLNPLDHSALLMGSAGTANARVAETIAVIRSQWAAMAEDGVSKDEMDDAKTFLTGSFPLQFSSSGRIAAILVAMQFENLGIDYLDRRNSLIDAVTLDAVNAMAKRLLSPAMLTFAVVGEPENIVVPTAR